MSGVIVGYGKYEGYELDELPRAALDELATRYQLKLDGQYRPEYDELLITVAIHQELQRRTAGGEQRPRVPTLRELAEEIVRLGYQQASRNHHPDGKGHHEAQIRLTQARDWLKQAASNCEDHTRDEGTTTIPAPPPPAAPPRAAAPRGPSGGISDDDVPF